MGIAPGMARLLLDESIKNPFSGSILQLGRQSIYFSPMQLEGWAGSHGVKLQIPAHANNPMNDVQFFRALGFDRVHSLDIKSADNSDFIHDLNQDIPRHLHGIYDLVLDGGTMEHIFDTTAVLRNIHRLLKVNGRIVHGSPCNNHRIDEGYHLFSPSFLWDFYEANGYRIDTCYLIRHPSIPHLGSWEVFPYPRSGMWKRIPPGRNKKCMSIYFVATKLHEFTDIRLPCQHRPKASSARARSAEKEAKRRAKLKKRGFFYWLSSLVGRSQDRKIKRFEKMPKPVARY